MYPNYKIIKTLQAGDYFGEIAAEYRVKRTAAVVTKTDCNLAVLENDYYNIYVSNKYFLTNHEIIKCFKKVSLFGGFPRYALHIMALNT